MSEIDDDLADLLGPDPEAEPETEALVDEAPKKSPSAALFARSRSYPVNGLPRANTPRSQRKNTPERLQRLLSYIAEMPITSEACKRAGISSPTIKYWLQKSLEGVPGDGFDVSLGLDDEVDDEGGTSIRFHDAWDAAMEMGVGLVERSVHERAIGYDEVLTYQGKVVYKIDPEKWALADMLGDNLDERNQSLWLRDQYGAAIPETVRKMDPDLAMFVLKTRKPKTYGPKVQVDMNVKGGVLVVGMQMTKPEDLNVLENQYRTQGLPDVLFEEDEAPALLDNTGPTEDEK